MKTIIALATLACLPLYACGYGAQSCQVIEAAHNACAVIKYMDQEGKEVSVQVPTSVLRDMAIGMAAAQAAQADGGAKK